MALPVQIAPEVTPSSGGGIPDRTPMAHTTPQLPTIAEPRYPQVSPETFGAARARIGRATEELGAGLSQAGRFFNQAAADDAANQYEDQVNKLLHGDPSKKGPDGLPDTGYFGLKGRAALDAREGVMKSMDELRKKTGGQLPALESSLRFSSITHRFRAITDSRVGDYADTQSKVWQTQVNGASAKLAVEAISRDAGDDQIFMDQTSNLIDARVKQAQLMGGGPELIKQAAEGAKQEALTARLNIVSTSDPARAMRMLQANKDVAGSQYDNLYQRFRARADQQVGREYADGVVGPQMPLENGADTKAVLRHFEGLIHSPKPDNDGTLRVGYGSDTVTTPDGKYHKVTASDYVTQADAERDLERRAASSQNDARRAVGEEAWGKLSDKAKASLTSISYNYGPNGFPKAVADAARTGDPNALAGAIVGLSGHNGGINARRRAQEAANVTGELPPPVSQADILQKIENSDLTPEAKASATARANHLYAIQHNAKITDKAEFNTSVKDSVAEAMQTGGTTNPVPQETFIKHYGASEGAVQYRAYQADLEFAATRQSFENIGEQEIQRTIDARIPEPGTPGYAHRMDQVNRLRKYADTLQTQRREDPAGAVSRSQAVKNAMANYDPKNPETFQPVAQARLAAQEAIGIDPEYQTPISKAEALQLTKPMQTMLPGQEGPTIRQVYSQFQKMYGDNADQAFGYALRARKVAQGTEQQAAAIVRSIANQERVTREQATAADAAREAAAANNAVAGKAPARPTPATPRVIGNPESNTGVEGSPVITNRAPPRAVNDLIRQPWRFDEFKKEYGQEEADRVKKQYPVLFKKAGPGGGGGGG